MSINGWLYLIDVSNNFSSIVEFFLFLYFAAFIILIINWFISSNELYKNGNEELCGKWLAWMIKRGWMFFLLIFMCAMSPSKNTMYLMLANKYLSDHNIPEKVSTILDAKLMDILNQIKKDAKND